MNFSRPLTAHWAACEPTWPYISITEGQESGIRTEERHTESSKIYYLFLITVPVNNYHLVFQIGKVLFTAFVITFWRHLGTGIGGVGKVDLTIQLYTPIYTYQTLFHLSAPSLWQFIWHTPCQPLSASVNWLSLLMFSGPKTFYSCFSLISDALQHI